MKLAWKQKFLSGALAAAMAFSAVPAAAAAEDVPVGTPYTADGVYDVQTVHVLINQVYGGSDNGVASHSFIEL